VLAQRKMLDWEGELLGPWPSLFYHGQLALPAVRRLSSSPASDKQKFREVVRHFANAKFRLAR